MMFKTGMFQIDPNSTPDQIARKREMIAAMLPKFGSAKYIGEGIGQLATGFMAGRQNRKLDRTESDGNATAKTLRDRILGGAASGGDPAARGPLSVLGMTPQPPADPNSPESLGNDTMAALGKKPSYRDSLVRTESGGNWQAQNNETGAGGKKGHYGRVQFGHARLEDAKRAGVLPPDMTPDMFMLSPEYQQRAEDWHFADLERELAPYVGTVVNGQTMDMGALVAMGHLGGAGGARKYVESGGQYNPADAYGTSLSDYASTHGGGGATPASGPASAAPSAPNIPTADLYALLTDPWQPPEVKALVQSMIGEQQQASDPLRQLQIQKAQMEVEQMGQPAGPPESLLERRALAEAADLQPGTPEYQTFLLTGKLPDPPEPGYTKITAEEATQLGLPPGSYQRGPKGEIKQIGGNGTNVTVNTGDGSPDLGKLSTDYGYLTGEDGKIKRDPVTGLAIAGPVPGSPAAQEAAQQEASRGVKTGNAITATDTVTTAAARAREAAGKRELGGFGAGIVGAVNPYSDSAEVERQIAVLQSNAKIGNLQSMRDASPTGGALGAVTAPELQMLADKSGALDQDSPNFLRDLDDYERTLLRTIHGPEEGDRIFQETRGGAAAPSGADGWTTLPNGVKVRVKQ